MPKRLDRETTLEFVALDQGDIMLEFIFNTYRSIDSIKTSLMCVHLFFRDVSLKYGRRIAPGKKRHFGKS